MVKQLFENWLVCSKKFFFEEKKILGVKKNRISIFLPIPRKFRELVKLIELHTSSFVKELFKKSYSLCSKKLFM
jgi:hypothetical protein